MEEFSEEALKAQDDKVVPLRLNSGGPIIGKAILKYVPETNSLSAEFQIDDPNVAEFLKGPAPNMFGRPVVPQDQNCTCNPMGWNIEKDCSVHTNIKSEEK